jgi:NADH-quinone oxidoreductase subunit J
LRMTLALAITSLFTAGSALAAVSLRNLVHCALALALSFLGLAALYLQLDAQFAGFAQVLVYIGAVAILMLFAILLTRSSEREAGSVLAPGWVLGGIAAALVFVVLAGTMCLSRALPAPASVPPEVTVKRIGEELMTTWILPLQVIGLLLTAALIGAVIIAMRERSSK